MGQKHVDCALLVYIVSCIPVNVASFAWGTCVHTGRQLGVRSSHDLHACFFDLNPTCARSARWYQFFKTALQLAKEKMHYGCAYLLVRE